MLAQYKWYFVSNEMPWSRYISIAQYPNDTKLLQMLSVFTTNSMMSTKITEGGKRNDKR